MNNDLISREALKIIIEQNQLVNAKLSVYDILKIIDNAPKVEYTFEEAFQKTVCENKLYCPARSQGEWIEFAKFVASEVCDDDFKDNSDCFAEVACRKLVKLGLLKLDGDTYKFCEADMKAVRNDK